MEIQWLKNEDNLMDCFSLRRAVFVEEQNFNEEFDEIDSFAEHLLIKYSGGAVGTARIFASKEDPQTYIAGRVCISKDHRGKKLGALIMEEIEKKAKGLGVKKICLNAQCRIRGFYEKLGYSKCGEEYFEQYCLHVPMEKLI